MNKTKSKDAQMTKFKGTGQQNFCIVGNESICRVQFKTCTQFSLIFWKHCGNRKMLFLSKIVFRKASFARSLILFQTSPGYCLSAVQVFWKHWWGGEEKLLVTSNFSFSPLCFLPFWRTFCHFHQILNCFLQAVSVWKSKICCLGKG